MKGIIDENFNSICNNLLNKIYMKNLKDARISIDVNPNNMV